MGFLGKIGLVISTAVASMFGVFIHSQPKSPVEAPTEIIATTTATAEIKSKPATATPTTQKTKAVQTKPTTSSPQIITSPAPAVLVAKPVAERKFMLSELQAANLIFKRDGLNIYNSGVSYLNSDHLDLGLEAFGNAQKALNSVIDRMENAKNTYTVDSDIVEAMGNLESASKSCLKAIAAISRILQGSEGPDTANVYSGLCVDDSFKVNSFLTSQDIIPYPPSVR